MLIWKKKRTLATRSADLVECLTLHSGRWRTLETQRLWRWERRKVTEWVQSNIRTPWVLQWAKPCANWVIHHHALKPSSFLLIRWGKDPTEITSRGNASKFYAAVCINIWRIGSVKKRKDIIGNQMVVKGVKNQSAPPFKTAECEPEFNRVISW